MVIDYAVVDVFLFVAAVYGVPPTACIRWDDLAVAAAVIPAPPDYAAGDIE